MTAVLLVSQIWKKVAEGAPYLWTNIVFGPAATPHDLLVAKQWLTRSKHLLLSVTIERDLTQTEGSDRVVVPVTDILSTIRPTSTRIQTFVLRGPHTTWMSENKLFMERPSLRPVMDIDRFFDPTKRETEVSHLPRIYRSCCYWSAVQGLLGASFPVLQTLIVVLDPHWITILHEHAAPSNGTPAFHPVDLPLLRTLHLSRFSILWPSECSHLTEIVLGHVSSLNATLVQLKTALESSPVPERLGFYQQILGLDATALAVDISIFMPSLTALSFRHTPPSCFRPFISLLDIPRFNDLTIALDEPQWSGDENASDLLLQLQGPFIAHRLRKLSIQSLAHPCDTAFSPPSPHLTPWVSTSPSPLLRKSIGSPWSIGQ
ncbi:hypothetical protein DFH08DRAFT_1088015 [Mycena albidolilacea]|uniref:Uncharacterized protein n=1 Tax=Mycena albidolilacea TaxID=1033008 RepID=A0AAD7EBW6_9AGAR|nr:hypothetical protein DFH08DRAFT_1088015 [Mycena albidolilacea]